MGVSRQYFPMFHMAYLEPRVEITELIRILNVMRSDIFVDTFPRSSIWFPSTLRRNKNGSSFCGLMLNTMHKYVTVRPTGILLRTTKWIVLLLFWLLLTVHLWVVQIHLIFCFARGIFLFLLLLALNPCTLVYPLCMYQQLIWIDTRVRVHFKSVWPCYVLLSEFLVPYYLFISLLP